MTKSVFAQIPKVDDLLQLAEPLIGHYGRGSVKEQIRDEVDSIRTQLKQDQAFKIPSDKEILNRVTDALDADHRPSLRPVINLTGTVLHTNLGRARLPDSA